ncbi:MAG: hypothetical protein WEF50_10665 [Myxococcota bacterium]
MTLSISDSYRDVWNTVAARRLNSKLQYAASIGDLKTVTRIIDDLAVDVRADNDLALLSAVEGGSRPIATLLLERGASPDAMCGAIHALARDRGDNEMTDLLKRYSRSHSPKAPETPKLD